MRVGFGYDSHRFEEGRPLILGGVEIPGATGLRAHSDGDAVAHAITDAILGAAAIGDIGGLFPDTDPENEDADSLGMLAVAVSRVESHGYRVHNVDAVVITERPAIGPHVKDMKARIAATLGVGPDRVSIKGKTNEGMGWIGRGEGLAVTAVASIVRPASTPDSHGG